MKQRSFLFFLTFTVSIAASAQVKEIIDAIKPKKAFTGIPALAKGSQVFSIGAGIPNNLAKFIDLGSFGSSLSSDKKRTGPFYASYEYFIKDKISIGAGVAYASAKQTYKNPFGTNKINASISGFSILFSSAYHFYTTNKIDPYLRGAIGVNIWKGSYKNDDGTDANKFSAPTPFGYSGILGLRYFVTKRFAPFGEVGFSSFKFSANIGVSYKLK